MPATKLGLPNLVQHSNNFAEVAVGPIRIWFSYNTPIAFQVVGENKVVRQNDWSNTTGKHLNEIDGGNKAGRIAGAEFEALLAAAAEGI